MWGCMLALLGLCIQPSPTSMELQSSPYFPPLSPSLQDIGHLGFLAELLSSPAGWPPG